MAVNLKRQRFAAHSVMAATKDTGGGAIVNLGAISWHFGLEDLTLYPVANAAIEGLTRSLAPEHGCHGIRGEHDRAGRRADAGPRCALMHCAQLRDRREWR